MTARARSPKKKNSKSASVRSISGGITAPEGFVVAAHPAGIKPGRDDVTLLFSRQLASAAAVFTVNQFPAAPVQLTRRHLEQSSHRARAVLINAGCANAGTGADGLRRAASTVAAVAASLEIPVSQILVASTGVIGDPLPADKIIGAVPALVAKLSARQWRPAARAICTTDTFEKTAAVEYRSGKHVIRIGGMAKGAGMIHPNMATMLGFLTTDAGMEPAVLQTALARAVDQSFHCITVDGDTSTNDMVCILANGSSDAPAVPGSGPGFERFCEALTSLCVQLAQSIARDGEGATRLLEICVRGARCFDDARRIGIAVAVSPLVKTAIYGRDANWGRILSAVGNSGVRLQADKVDIAVQGHRAVSRGVVIPSRLTTRSPIWKPKTFRVAIDLHDASSSATVWSCDLTHRYVDINASYRS